ncbi:MAG: nucleotidyltransferase domain-containing protein [Deltaproteobacteria bacterium]|nr:nucleotidyltransferase domain-containing protein [Deltaproteobacteria bacterium]MCL5891562.1 nucleotidyltransferase domain-containing protein [Deltaproteobacteria bacterium]
MLAFIFGSFAAKRLGKNSDLDIAVLYENPPTGFEILREIDKLSKIVGMETHLAILNAGSPLFKHQVMKNKINLVIKDEKFFGKFRENVISQYDEYKYISGMDKYDR